MKLAFHSIVLFLTLTTLGFSKPKTQDHEKACPIQIVANADGRALDLPLRSATMNFENNGRTQMILVLSEVILEFSLHEPEFKKLTDFKIVAIPFISKKVNVVCNKEIKIKYFIKGEIDKEYNLKIADDRNNIYKEFTKRLDAKTEDSDTFSFQVSGP